MDNFTKVERSDNMRKIKSKNTKPELLVRSTIHEMGYRFRLHQRDLAGKPDLVLPKYKVVIFVHGCFWHQHSCIDGHVPKSRRRYWANKLEKNVKRDRRHLRELKKLGWLPLVIWECEARNPVRLKRKLERTFANATRRREQSISAAPG